MKYPKIVISKCFQLEIGRKYIKVGSVVYHVGNIIKGMRFYTSETGKEYYEVNARLTSTNIRKKTASFKGIGGMNHKGG